MHPTGHNRPIATVIDRSLERSETVWCAAGTPNAVFEIKVEALLGGIPDADVRDVTE